MIRPQGDVLFEYLEVLPSLAKGVVVHFHDRFSPERITRASGWKARCDFGMSSIFWEAFLSNNHSRKLVGALNYLSHHHYETQTRSPRFWILAGNGGTWLLLYSKTV